MGRSPRLDPLWTAMLAFSVIASPFCWAETAQLPGPDGQSDDGDSFAQILFSPSSRLVSGPGQPLSGSAGCNCNGSRQPNGTRGDPDVRRIDH